MCATKIEMPQDKIKASSRLKKQTDIEVWGYQLWGVYELKEEQTKTKIIVKVYEWKKPRRSDGFSPDKIENMKYGVYEVKTRGAHRKCGCLWIEIGCVVRGERNWGFDIECENLAW